MSDYLGSASVNLPGENQILPEGHSHFIPLTKHSNKVQAGRMLMVESAPAGAPDAANPLGRGSSTSIAS